MVRKIVVILVVCTFIGALMPSREAPAGGEAAVKGASDWGSAAEPLVASADSSSSWSSSTAAPSTEQSSSGPLSLRREPNGHFFADARVNGATIRFLVDTGASDIALTVEDARKAGVRTQGASSVIGSGASGAVMGHQVTIDRVQLGPRSSTQLSGVVIEGGSQSLLGQSFLAKFASVEIKGDVMTLR